MPSPAAGRSRIAERGRVLGGPRGLGSPPYNERYWLLYNRSVNDSSNLMGEFKQISLGADESVSASASWKRMVQITGDIVHFDASSDWEAIQ